MIKGTVVACALAAVAVGVSACSSGGGNLPGGVSATCKTVWTFSASSTVYPTYAAAASASSAQFGPLTPDSAQLPWQLPEFNITASSTVDIGSVNVVFYTKSGSEDYSTSGQFPVNATIAAGQSYTDDDTSSDLSSQDPNTGSTTSDASCQVVGWSAPGQN